MCAATVSRRRAHWQSGVALLAVAVASAQQSNRFRCGPPWLLLAVVDSLPLILPLARLRGHAHLTRALGLAAAGLVTAAVGTSVIMLGARLPTTTWTARGWWSADGDGI